MNEKMQITLSAVANWQLKQKKKTSSFFGPTDESKYTFTLNSPLILLFNPTYVHKPLVSYLTRTTRAQQLLSRTNGFGKGPSS